MTKPKIGRPRSVRSQSAIIDATNQLLNEGGGAGLTIEAIAARAGVGKPTIYRWWPSLPDLVLDGLLKQADAKIAVPPFTSLRETLGQFLRRSMEVINEGAGVHLRFLMANAQQNEGFRQRFRDTFTARRRAVLHAILKQGVDGGHLDPAQNLELLVDLIFGAMWFRLLTGHAAMDETFADELTDVIVALGDPDD